MVNYNVKYKLLECNQEFQAKLYYRLSLLNKGVISKDDFYTYCNNLFSKYKKTCAQIKCGSYDTTRNRFFD